MAFNRAMTEAQKEARRADILKVALHRFTLMPYESLNMADTADEAGVAKGTLYLYFRSKEEMFLAIYTDQLNGWFDAMDAEAAGQIERRSQHLGLREVHRRVPARPSAAPAAHRYPAHGAGTEPGSRHGAQFQILV